MKDQRIGKVYGELTVCARCFENTSYGAKRYVCECSCQPKRYVIVSSKELESGGTRSCGHLRVTNVRKANIRHGKKLTPEYTAYASAKNRCQNPRNSAYDRYGGRGIEFKFDDFDHFDRVLGTRPDGCSLDRIDVDGPYAPGNVRWATSKQQARNRRCDNCDVLKAKIAELEARILALSA